MRRLILSSVLLFIACSSSPGPQGEQGPQGPVGLAGAQGQPGVQGERGVQGEVGPEGQQGVPGPVGPAGMVLVLDGGVVTGPAGAPVVITQLSPGSACATGGVRVTQLVDGGTVDVCNGAAGPSPTVTTAMTAQCPTGGLLIGLPDGGSMPLCNGAQGAQGPQGIQGTVGVAGPTGPQGPIGMTGIAGPAGPAGPTGATGGVGPAGPSGPQGPAGPQGIAGPSPSVSVLSMMSQQCPTGGLLVGLPDGGSLPLCNGATGATGATGGVGPAGPQGIAGPVGPAGATGGVGPAGPQGNVGPAGAAGPAGPTGVAGPQGAVGPAGSVLFLDGGVVVVTSPPVQFVGFTQLTYTGALGGLPGAAEKCRLDFAPDSYLCTVADYDNANTTAIPPSAAGAWVDYNRADTGARSASACGSGNSPWTSAAVQFTPNAPRLSDTGYSGVTECTASKHLACCRGGRGTFRGYTTATYNGNLGGLPGANAKCRVDFPGSWLCTVAEYDLSNSALRPPTTAGAWIDYNRAANGARSNSACGSGNSPWTSAAVQFTPNAPHLSQVGYAGVTECTAVKHLACCGGQ